MHMFLGDPIPLSLMQFCIGRYFFQVRIFRSDKLSPQVLDLFT